MGSIAVGPVAVILLASSKGSDTRKKIQQKGTHYADDLKDKLDNLSGTLKNNYDKMLHNGKDLIVKSKSKFDDIKNCNS